MSLRDGSHRSLLKTLLRTLLWGGLIFFGQLAHAQDCHVNGSFGMDFGQVTGGGASRVSSLSITCSPDYTGGTNRYYQVCIYLGPGEWSAGQPTRRMHNYNNAYLNYDLFADPTHTQLIGAPGTTPVYQVPLLATPGTPVTEHVPIYGWVYPGQAVLASHYFQEQGIPGTLRFRYSTSGYPNSSDCMTGGSDGGMHTFSSSGVIATYDNSCWVVAGDLNFGSTEPPRQALREHSNIRVQCAPNTPWRVGLSEGQNSDGSTRRMLGPGGGYVRYELYLDEAHTRVWGDDETSRASGTTDIAGNTVSLTVYGEVPMQPDLAVGTYVDTVVATLYY